MPLAPVCARASVCDRHTQKERIENLKAMNKLRIEPKETQHNQGHICLQPSLYPMVKTQSVSYI